MAKSNDLSETLIHMYVTARMKARIKYKFRSTKRDWLCAATDTYCLSILHHCQDSTRTPKLINRFFVGTNVYWRQTILGRGLYPSYAPDNSLSLPVRRCTLDILPISGIRRPVSRNIEGSIVFVAL